MGCQGVAIRLPVPGTDFPACRRTYVVVVGGESGEEEGWDSTRQQPPQVRQFRSTLAYDTEEKRWCPEMAIPPTNVPRTAMAVCVGYGQIQGHPLYSKRSR